MSSLPSSFVAAFSPVSSRYAKGSSADASRNFALGRPGYYFQDLFDPERLAALDALFRTELEKSDAPLAAKFDSYRAGAAIPGLDESELLIKVATPLSRFVADLFGVTNNLQGLLDQGARERQIARFKEFVGRRAAKKLTVPQAIETDGADLFAKVRAVVATFPALAVANDEEMNAARVVGALLDAEDRMKALAPGAAPPAGWVDPGPSLHVFELWAAVHLHSPAARAQVTDWVSFTTPHKLDHDNLVPLRRPRTDLPNFTEGPISHRRRRDGFRLTDRRMNARQVQNEVDYCLYCHGRDKDSCSKGLRDKDGGLKANPIGVKLAGCPLNERISEMHVLKRDGDSLGALLLIVIDNPMVPGTGHRICNDCMKACVYQKQEPVNIPQAETGVLTDVLNLPYGFEIYTFLTRWNPLNRRRPYALPYNGKNVMVVGLGPSGYTLSHHLLNEGFGVVGVEGLKVEPLPADLVGADEWPPRAIARFSDFQTELDARVLTGFGGVAEYGITSRWDKNFLTTLHLGLARRQTFRIYGGVRYGGTLTTKDAFAAGFDHIAIAAGAGKPTIIDIKNNLIRGVRKASDFLMALQLSGAYKKESLANLQVRLPALVIGGGLTGIDTTTEVAAYYPVQVEKFLDRFETLATQRGEDALWKSYDAEEKEVAEEFLAHGKAVRGERARAAALGEDPDLAKLVNAWGGVALVYRKSINDSPAYRLNHEEISEFFEEGVGFIENLRPVECVADARGALQTVVFENVIEDAGAWRGTGDMVRLPARSLFVAAGTTPNITYEKEHPGSFAMNNKARAFSAFKVVRTDDGTLALAAPQPGEVGFFTSYCKDGRFISFYGDNNPAYAGSVVKAMASAKDGYPYVAALFADEFARQRAEDQPARDAAFTAFVERLDTDLRATVHEVNRLTPTIVEVVVHAPAAARNFQPGQFFRLQNFESLSPLVNGTRLQMEGIALTGAWVDKAAGLLSMIVLEMGGSSRLCAALKPGEPVVVMGPTGAPTEIPKNESVALCGGGLGNAVLFSIARALRDNGCRVLYFAGYRSSNDIYKVEEIEAATDQVIWSIDSGDLPQPRRPQDRAFRGNIVESMRTFASGGLGEVIVRLEDCQRIIAIGSDRMMAAVTRARHGVLKPHMRPGHEALASINSPMQCMLKEVCAQCLQRHVDPVTGKESFVFTCFNQDQPQDTVDWGHLATRLRQNTVQEKLTDAWLARALDAGKVERI